MDELENNTNDEQENLEQVANQLSELYELEETIQTSAEREIQQSLQALGFAPHLHKRLDQLSSG